MTHLFGNCCFPEPTRRNRERHEAEPRSRSRVRHRGWGLPGGCGGPRSDYGHVRRVAEGCGEALAPERLHKIQADCQKAVLGLASGQRPQEEPNTLAEPGCPRGSAPLSLWDWEIWTKARPTLWCYGDAGNLDPKRSEVPLLTDEWITAMCWREDMEYDVEGDTEPFKVHANDDDPEVNRFAGDWITLHLFASLFWLTGRHQSASPS